jgi:hypothetical protein
MASSNEYVKRLTVSEVIVELAGVHIVTMLIIGPVIELCKKPPHRTVNCAVVDGLFCE